jgi:hypothetical protein
MVKQKAKIKNTNTVYRKKSDANPGIFEHGSEKI